MIKKMSVALIFICTLLICTNLAYAQELECNKRVSENTICIFGKCTPLENVAVLVGKNGGEIVMAVNAEADENGAFNTPRVAMPDFYDENLTAAGGTYNITVATESGEIFKTSFVYISRKEVNDYIKALNTSSSDTEFKAAFNCSKIVDLLDSVGLDAESFIAADKAVKESVENELYKKKPFVNTAAFSECFYNAYITALISHAPTDTQVKELLVRYSNGIIGLTVDGDSFSENATVMQAIAKYIFGIKTVADVNEINKEIQNGYILYCLNSSNKASLAGNVTKYFKALNLENNDYFEKYKTNYDFAIKVSEQTILKMPKDGFASLSDFAAVFTDKLSSVTATPSTVIGGGGGGGASAGKTGQLSGNGSFSYAATTAVGIFDDLDDASWAKESIGELYKKGIVSGKEDKKFCPNVAVTREEFIKMTVLAFSALDLNARCSFNDVSEDSWFYSFVATAQRKNIVNGNGNNMFGVGTFLTRQDAASILYRAADKVVVNGKTSFSDSDAISDYAKEAVSNLALRGVISGFEDGCFLPLGNITRAQAAKLIYMLLQEGEAN